MAFTSDFLMGAATAAHQVEGNNIHSDFWAMEQLEHSSFTEPSLDCVDHYNAYEQDIKLMAGAGLNAYRFSIEWARIEPVQGHYDEAEIEHYRKVLECCRDNGITPVVTMHHFSSPKWLISAGGWEAESTIGYFKDYCVYVVSRLGDLMGYVCTINEANMGLQLATIIQRMLKQMGVTPQVGMNMPLPETIMAQMAQTAAAFGIADPREVHTFLSQRTKEGDALIMRAHEAARDAMKTVCPHLKIGVTLSLHDIQSQADGEEAAAARAWEEEFTHYLPYLKKDDFFGVQNYTREVYGATGIEPAPAGALLTQMGYEVYPQALEAVIRRVHEAIPALPLLVTENGLATSDDYQRVTFIEQALNGVKACIADGIPVQGYLYWSLLDNFEWQKGFSMTFGLVAVDRTTQTRSVKPSLSFLGAQRKEEI